MSNKLTAKQSPISATIPVQPLKPSAAIPSFDKLPDSALIREAQLVRSVKRPDVPVPLPFSAATLWRMVRAGTFPAPHKLSQRVTAWTVGDVRGWIANQMAEA
ncbi:helix-turn-helix transcriptional regulator [Rhodoferax sp.]|uniref:helix-turn-helix transcriptional regulator n=1 Tax=Rhodoferax sp. TaxID=50421 RepID=UPI00374C9C4D